MKDRILIVEDDDSIRRLLEVALKSQGFDVGSFDNAVDALEDMAQQTPALVTMDIMMDGLDGIEALKIMRASPALSQVPVILLTAKGMEDDKVAGLDAGADDYVTKPFSVLELCAPYPRPAAPGQRPGAGAGVPVPGLAHQPGHQRGLGGRPAGGADLQGV